jgi:hypothetical protein
LRDGDGCANARCVARCRNTRVVRARIVVVTIDGIRRARQIRRVASYWNARVSRGAHSNVITNVSGSRNRTRISRAIIVIVARNWGSATAIRGRAGGGVARIHGRIIIAINERVIAGCRKHAQHYASVVSAGILIVTVNWGGCARRGKRIALQRIAVIGRGARTSATSDAARADGHVCAIAKTA